MVTGASLPVGTYSVSDLSEELRFILSEALSGVWVAGEVRRPLLSRAGHMYFELVEKDDHSGVRATLSVVIFRQDFQRLRRVLLRSGVEITEGQTLRCLGNLDFYPGSGRVQLIVRDADPLFALGDMARRRQETIDTLRASGLLEKNGALALVEPTLRLALLSSPGSAAHRDFMTTLEASRYRFEVRQLEVTVQGASAEREIVAALSTCARASSWLDAVVVVRGGGSKSDLATFDVLAVARAVASCPVPVLTGLGHQIDESVVDLVAHRAFKTPTAVAEFLVQRVSLAERRLTHFGRQLLVHARSQLRSQDLRVERSLLRTERAGARLSAAARTVEERARELSRVSRSQVRRQAERTSALARLLRTASRPALRRVRETVAARGTELSSIASRRLGIASVGLEANARMIEHLSPRRVLQRGFSITRIESGHALRSAAAVCAGQRVVTELAAGTFSSLIEEVDEVDEVEEVEVD